MQMLAVLSPSTEPVFGDFSLCLFLEGASEMGELLEDLKTQMC